MHIQPFHLKTTKKYNLNKETREILALENIQRQNGQQSL